MTNNAITFAALAELRDQVAIREQQLKQCQQQLNDVNDWFIGMIGVMNNEEAQHNKSVPVGNFEHAIKTHIQNIDKVLKQTGGIGK